MKKILLIMLLLITCIGFAQKDVVVEEPVKTETVYELGEDSVTIEKKYNEEIVIYTTLEEISTLIDKYNADIEANINQISYFQSLITKLEDEYTYLKEVLGAKENEK